MRAAGVALACMLLPAVASAECPGIEPQDLSRHPTVQERLALFEEWIEAHRVSDDWPGVAMGIVVDQQLVWARGFGHADVTTGARMDPGTLVPIASNTKMFTAIAALKLQQDGKLRLDDPVVKYLPWARGLGESDVNLRGLLTHSSGLQREVPGTSWTDGRFPSRRQMMTELAGRVMVSAPGNRWKYSNLGSAIVGAIIESAAGVPYEQYVADTILRPLGMTETTFTAPGSATTARGYTRRIGGRPRQPVPPVALGADTPAVGLWSSVNDLARFAAWQFRVLGGRGDEVLRASTLRDMQRVHWLDPSWTFGLGLGFLIYRDAPHDLVGHGGNILGYATDLTISPHDKIAVITLVNGEGIHVYPDQRDSISQKAFTWVVPALRDALACRGPLRRAEPTLARYAGRYRDVWSDAVVLTLDGELVLTDPLDPPPAEKLARLVPVGDHRFRVDSNDGFSNLAAGEILEFDRDSSGAITGFRLAGRRLTRLASW